jgi:hypothetical protein
MGLTSLSRLSPVFNSSKSASPSPLPGYVLIVHRSTLDAIRKEWVDHDAKGHVRQLLTSEHIDEEIQDLNRRISNAIGHILVSVLKGMPQEADMIAHVA